MGKKDKKMKDDLEKKTKKKKSKKDKSTKSKARETLTTNYSNPVDPTLRYQMIETAAYFIAERHGFNPSKAVEDWTQAEHEIDAYLKETNQVS
jgi:hypothetical protein